MFREMQSDEDREKLQQDIDELLIWSKKWQLPFNESKCKVMHYGKTNRKADYNLGGVQIVEVSEEKDLGVTFDVRACTAMCFQCCWTSPMEQSSTEPQIGVMSFSF